MGFESGNLSLPRQNVFDGNIIYASVFQLIISKNQAKFVYYLAYNLDESEWNTNADNWCRHFLPHLYLLMFAPSFGNLFYECTWMFTYGWNFIKCFISFSVWAFGATYNGAKSPYCCKHTHNFLPSTLCRLFLPSMPFFTASLLIFGPSFGNLFCECTLMFNYGWNFIKWYISLSVWVIGATYNAANLSIVANAPTTYCPRRYIWWGRKICLNFDTNLRCLSLLFLVGLMLIWLHFVFSRQPPFILCK